MYTRSNVEFPTSNNLMLRGWLYTPHIKNFLAPCIIMTHGFSALKEHYLDQFAARFAEAGMFVLVYDNRNFGDSDADVRNEVDPNAQILDMQNAITFVQGITTNIDAGKIGLWGTSFSAGIVLEVASKDKRVRCVAVQVPFVSGHHDFLQSKKPDQWERISKQYQEDMQARESGKTPEIVNVVTPNLDHFAVMKQPEAYTFFTSIPNWENYVTLQSLAKSGNFYPIKNIEQISPIPLLFIVADNDTINPTKLALKAYKKALEPKQLLIIPGHHFSAYHEQFEVSVSAALDWFKKYLT